MDKRVKPLWADVNRKAEAVETKATKRQTASVRMDMVADSTEGCQEADAKYVTQANNEQHSRAMNATREN
jgi:hypothetical protein